MYSINLPNSQRLTFRAVTVNDASFILSLCNSKGYLKFIGDKGLRNNADAINHINTHILTMAKMADFTPQIVTLTGSTTPMGTVGLYQRDFLPQQDIGFAFMADFECKGYAFEACQALLEYAKNTMKLTTIFALTALYNPRSKALLKRLDFEPDTTIKEEHNCIYICHLSQT